MVGHEFLEAAFSALVCGAWARRAAGLFVAALAFSSRAWRNLFLRILLSRFSNSRAAGPRRLAARGKLSGPRGGNSRQSAILVCANSAVARFQRSSTDGAVLGGNDRLVPADSEYLAARNAGNLFRDVS